MSSEQERLRAFRLGDDDLTELRGTPGRTRADRQQLMLARRVESAG